MRVLERTTTPVAIVPPDIASSPRRGIRRLLLPLEGTEESSRPLVDQLFPLLAAEVELTVLHVFTPDTTPRILDRPHRDLAMWGHEFLARHCPMAERIEWRQGPIGHGAIELCDEQDVDLVVLSWSQDASPGRATVVREILARSRIPVLLLPTRPDAGA